MLEDNVVKGYINMTEVHHGKEYDGLVVLEGERFDIQQFYGSRVDSKGNRVIELRRFEIMDRNAEFVFDKDFVQLLLLLTLPLVNDLYTAPILRVPKKRSPRIMLSRGFEVVLGSDSMLDFLKAYQK